MPVRSGCLRRSPVLSGSYSKRPPYLRLDLIDRLRLLLRIDGWMHNFAQQLCGISTSYLDDLQKFYRIAATKRRRHARDQQKAVAKMLASTILEWVSGKDTTSNNNSLRMNPCGLLQQN